MEMNAKVRDGDNGLLFGRWKERAESGSHSDSGNVKDSAATIGELCGVIYAHCKIARDAQCWPYAHTIYHHPG